jgi:peptide deformylase
MTAKEVIRMGHPCLRTPAEDYPIDDIGTAQFETLIEDMRDTLHAYGGIGLAAPQIGVGYRIAIIEIENTQTRYGEVEYTPFDVYINPLVTCIKEGQAGYWEGCLSVPGMRGFVERPQHIRIDYLDQSGNSSQKEVHGFLATVFQHEIDHLDGVLYVDRIKDKSLFAYEQEYLQFHADPEPAPEPKNCV